MNDLHAEDWWRTLCEVTPRFHLSGDLPTGDREFARNLDLWLDAGITDIVDVRDEWSDAPRVAWHAPDVDYHWLGTHDNGGRQDPAWFDAGVTAITDALAEPDRRVVVHCHMGVNRAPSMAFAALLAKGHEIEDALDLIRAARPIAAIAYAEDAIRWWAIREGCAETDLQQNLRIVRLWHQAHGIDVARVIRRIRKVEAS